LSNRWTPHSTDVWPARRAPSPCPRSCPAASHADRPVPGALAAHPLPRSSWMVPAGRPRQGRHRAV